jgi:hypothetical protein
MRVTSVLPGNKSVSSEHKNVAYDDKTVVPQFVACVHMALKRISRLIFRQRCNVFPVRYDVSII